MRKIIYNPKTKSFSVIKLYSESNKDSDSIKKDPQFISLVDNIKRDLIKLGPRFSDSVGIDYLIYMDSRLINNLIRHKDYIKDLKSEFKGNEDVLEMLNMIASGEIDSADRVEAEESIEDFIRRGPDHAVRGHKISESEWLKIVRFASNLVGRKLSIKYR